MRPDFSKLPVFSRAGAAFRTMLMALPLISVPLAAHAQVIVVQSKVKGLQAGKLLDEASNVRIPKGQSVLFVLPSGATRAVSGPFNGRAADLTKGVKSNPGVFDAVKRYVKSGGANRRNVGALRSAAPAFALGKRIPFSWTKVPLTASGDYCLKKGANVVLVRSRPAREQVVTIVDMRSQRRAQVTFPAGKDSVAWPEEIPVDAGSTYALLRVKQPMRKLRIRMISPLPRTEHTLQVLHSQRCSNQFRAYIREIQG